MIVLGLTGYARSGKDTVADYLVEAYGFEKVSFAAPLKRMLRRLNPVLGPNLRYGDHGAESIRVEHLYEMYGDDDAIKASPYGDEMRDLWQRLGTECVRAEDEDFWVNAAMRQLTNPDGRYVFTDCRFPNEADAIRDVPYGNWSGVWRVDRPGVAAVNGHASEAHVGHMGENCVISNNGTLDELKTVIDAYMHISFGLNKEVANV